MSEADAVEWVGYAMGSFTIGYSLALLIATTRRLFGKL